MTSEQSSSPSEIECEPSDIPRSEVSGTVPLIRLKDVIELLLQKNHICSDLEIKKHDKRLHRTRDLDMKSDDVILNRIAECNKQKNSRNFKLIGVPGSSNQIHNKLELEYWKTKLEFHGLHKLSAKNTENEIPTSEKLFFSAMSDDSKSSSTYTNISMTEKGSDSFQNYLYLLRLHSGIQSAPIDGKDVIFDVRNPKPIRNAKVLRR